MNPIRILLADDHAVVRAGIRQFLERAADLQVIAEADDGEMAQELVEPPTDREAEVLILAARGYTNKAIAVQLNISDRTVQGHLAKIFIKLQAASRTEAVMRAVSFGWISADLSS